VSDLTVGGHGAGGTVEGSISGGDAKVLISQKYSFAYLPEKPQVVMWTKDYILTAIHELVHLAGSKGLSDGRLAEAAYDLGYSDKAIPDPDTYDINRIFNHSGSWGGALSKFCGPL